MYKKTLNQNKVLANLEKNKPEYSLVLILFSRISDTSHCLHQLASVLPVARSLGQGDTYRKREPGTPSGTVHGSCSFLGLGQFTGVSSFPVKNGLNSFAMSDSLH